MRGSRATTEPGAVAERLLGDLSAGRLRTVMVRLPTCGRGLNRSAKPADLLGDGLAGQLVGRRSLEAGGAVA